MWTILLFHATTAETSAEESPKLTQRDLSDRVPGPIEMHLQGSITSREAVITTTVHLHITKQLFLPNLAISYPIHTCRRGQAN